MMLDLHGYTIHVAWNEFKKHVADCYHQKVKTTMVITGQGDISKELPTWATNSLHVRSCVQSQRNPGMYTIHITKTGKRYESIGTLYNQTTKVDVSPLVAKFNKV